MTEQSKSHELMKLKTFLAGERRQMNALQAPDGFAEHLRKLAADYDLREQALAEAPLPADNARPAAQLPARQLKPRFRKRRFALPPSLAAAVAIAALIVCAITLTLPGDSGWPQRFAGLVEIKAAYAAGHGIDVNEGFIISASQPLSADLVEMSLQVYPNFDYQIERQDDATYHVLPLTPLEQNTVYHLSFDPERAQDGQPVRAEYSWSFQTEAPLELVESSPTDAARGVPAEAALNLIFSGQIDQQAVDYISIEPQVDGEWQAEGANLYFLPASGWAYDTVYTVRVAEGLPALDSPALTQNQLIRFSTEQPPSEPFAFSVLGQGAADKTFAPQETPNWLLYEQQEGDDSPYAASLYAVPDAYTYATFLHAQGSSPLSLGDLPQLELLAQYELSTLTGQQGYTLALPDSLAPGFYALSIEKQGHERMMLFQVSGLSAYLASGVQDRLFWLHDGAGNPLFDALVLLWPQGEERGRSDKNGVALLSAAKQGPGQLIYCIETEQESLVLTVEQEPAPLLATPCHRWALYTEQSRYRAGQTLNYFGVCETRRAENGDENSSQLTLRLKTGGADPQVLPYTVAAAGGAFNGSLTLPGLRSGWYELALYDDDIYVGGSYIQVVDDAEQLWQLNLQPLAAIAMEGDQAQWQVQALYQGQPVPNVEIELLDMELGTTAQSLTDEDGLALLSLPLLPTGAQEPLDRREFQASALFPGEQTAQATASMQVLRYDAFVEAAASAISEDSWELQLTPYSLSLTDDGAEAVRGEFNGIITLSATLINLDDAPADILPEQPEEQPENQPKDQPEEQLEEQSPAAEQLTGSIEAEDPAGNSGEATDQPQMTDFTWELNGGFTHLQTITAPQPGVYSLFLRGEDSGGRPFELELPLPNEQEQPLLLYDAYSKAGQEQHDYAPGEAVELSLYLGAAPLLPASGSEALFVLAGAGIVAYQPTDASMAAVQAEDIYPAAFQGWAVYYEDGRYYESASLPLCGEQPPLAQLEVQCQPMDDAAEGMVRLSLSLSDANGEPLPAILNLNLLNSSQQEPQAFAGALYSGMRLSPYRHFTNDGSDELPDGGLPALLSQPVAENRVLPADEAVSSLFVTLPTDARGQAEVEFALPKDGQNWFLCWHAYEGERQITASGVVELDLRQPLSLECIFGQEFAVGDEPTLRFMATGQDMRDGETINYELSLPGLAYQHSAEATVGQWCEVRLPMLSAGSYELRLTASSTEYYTVRLLPFTVHQESYGGYTLERQRLLVDSSLDIDSEQDITLVFGGPEHAGTLEALFALAEQDTARLDSKLAALAAARLLGQYSGWEGLADKTDSLPLYQQENGGLAALPHSAASQKLSALAAPVITEQIDRQALVAYLRECYAQTQEQETKALALYGLASLEQPVLLDIALMAAEQTSLDTRLYLALAYMACGNGAAAKAMAVDLLAANLRLDEDGLPQASGFAAEDEATAHLALLAQIFELPQAQGLYSSLMADGQPGYAQTLAKARILAERCRSLPPNAYFTYRLDGSSRQVSLREHGFYSLTLPVRQLAGLTFSEVVGEVELSAIFYRQGLPAVEEDAERLAGLERGYRQQGKSVLSRENGLLEVRLDFSLPESAPPGYYRLEDTLPAGLRFYELDQEASSRRVGLFARDGATVSFDVYKGEGAYYGSVVYTAWVYAPGLYTAAAPRLYSVRQPWLNAVGEEQQVQIR